MLYNNRKKQRLRRQQLMLFELVLLLCSCCWRPICCHGLSTAPESDTGRLLLLKTQDGYIIDESIQPAEQDLRLEDFFWTGSGDGPPHYARKPNMASESDGSTGRDTILKTATVVATVYIDQAQDTEPINCVYDCEEDENGDISDDYFPTDRRYWLLTILGGHYQTHDYTIIEQKLASLYRIAFSRQQLWHLGVNGHQPNHTSAPYPETSSAAPPTIAQAVLNRILPTKYSEYNNQPQVSEKAADESFPLPPTPHLLSKRSIGSDATTTTITSTTTTLNESDTNDAGAAGTVPLGHPMPLRVATKSTQAGTRISVLVHNITLLSDDDEMAARGTTNGANGPSPKPIENQTEIIYSVFVDGKPVLAVTAADDMQLVTEEEVARVMDKMVYTKAEPYVKEPLATPLVPPGGGDDDPDSTPTDNRHANVMATLLERPVWIAIGSVLIVMVIVLFIGLMLMTRSKRLRSAELKRLTTHRALIEESANQMNAAGAGSSHDVKPDDDAVAVEGNDNLAFVDDGAKRRKEQEPSSKSGQPIIHFPQPPVGSPSSSSTSDSSIYYPKRRSRLDIQQIIDEKAINLFHHKKHTKRMSDQEDALYATIDKKKERKLKQKRKYTTNRVGSIEHDSDSAQGSISDHFETTSRRTHYYDPVEAINVNAAPNNYHQNKLLGNHNFTGRPREEDGLAASPTEAYNREVIRTLYRDNQSPESGSIGSFLSMASVRSFPKCSMPEPLNRVLEPLSVMHLDQSDGGLESGRRTKPRAAKATNKKEGLDHSRRGGEVPFVRSQSDGADPGVIGPVVWEIHKKQLEQSGGVLSPIRDPVQTRHRFEGLLEGAINMYSGDISNEVIDEINSTTDKNATHYRRKDARLKTAIPSRKPSILSRSNTEYINRPVTAGPTKQNHEEPPSPYRRAWGSGAPSPLVRPLSAGPFHRPEPPHVDVTRVLAPQSSTNILSTAPLIEAIQNELKKFDKPK